MKNKILTLFAIVLVTLSVGCNKLFTGGYSKDPNNPSDAPIDQIIPGLQSAAILYYEGEPARDACLWAGQFTGADRQYESFQNYTVQRQDFNNMWDQAYTQIVNQARLAETKATAVNNQKALGVAQVMDAQIMGSITSLWGDVPDAQAGDQEKYPNPKFDSQAQIYASVQTKLSNALTNLQGGGTFNSSEDIFYGGDLTAWAHLAHTLKARFYLQTNDYKDAITQAEQGIMDPKYDMVAKHGTSYNGDFNIYYSFLVYDRADYMDAAGSHLTKMMNPGSSPSDSVDFQTDPKTNEQGRYNYYFINYDIYNNGTELNYLSNFDWGTGQGNDGKFGTESPMRYASYEENLLILAEAYARSNDNTNALKYFNQEREYMAKGGYIADMNLSGNYLTDYANQFDDYTMADFSSGGSMYDGTSTNSSLITAIVKEAYIALCGQIPAFALVRRSDNQTRIGVTPNTGSKIPQRFLIPQIEINSNSNAPKTLPGFFDKTPVNQGSSS